MMFRDRRLQATLLIFLVVSVCALVLTLSRVDWINVAFIIAITIFSGLFAWLSSRKVTPVPFHNGQFRKDLLLVLVLFVSVMIVRTLGFWQEFVLAEKAGMIALSISAILLIDRSSPTYFGLNFDKILKQLLWFIGGFAVIWAGFALVHIISPMILGLKSTSIFFELPKANVESLYFLLMYLFGNFAEEIFFRGYIQTKLEQSTGFIYALLIQSVLFALYHIIYLFTYRGSDPLGYIGIYLLFTMLFGLGVGMFYKLSRSILASTLLHASWNFFITQKFLIPKVMIENGKTWWDSSGWDYMVATVLFVIVMAILLFIRCRKARKCGQAF